MWRKNIEEFVRLNLEVNPLIKWYREKYNLPFHHNLIQNITLFDIEQDLQEEKVWRKMKEDLRKKTKTKSIDADTKVYTIDENGEITDSVKNESKLKLNQYDKFTEEEIETLYDDDDFLLQYDEKDVENLKEFLKQRETNFGR